jgi:hypothetical protein
MGNTHHKSLQQTTTENAHERTNMMCAKVHAQTAHRINIQMLIHDINRTSGKPAQRHRARKTNEHRKMNRKAPDKRREKKEQDGNEKTTRAQQNTHAKHA